MLKRLITAGLASIVLSSVLVLSFSLSVANASASPTKPYNDVALTSKGAQVISNPKNPNYIIDGDTFNYHTSTGFTTTAANVNDPIIIELDQVYTINTIDLLLWDLDDRYYQYYIEVSEDNINWEKVIDKTSGEHRSWQNNYFENRNVKYIKLVGTKNSIHYYFHAVELNAYYSDLAPKAERDVALASKGATVISNPKNPNYIIDGDTFNYHTSTGFTTSSAYGNDPITIELDNVYTIDSIDLLLWDLDDRYYQYYIEVSKDNVNWEKVVDKTTGEHRSWQNNYIGNREVKYIRVVGTKNSVHYYLNVVELKAYYNNTAKKSSDSSLSSKGAKIYNGVHADAIIDGIKTGYTIGSGFGYSNFKVREPLIIEFDDVYLINQINLHLWDLDNRYSQYYIDISADNKSWERVVDKTAGEHRSFQDNYIGDKKVKYIRIVGTYTSVHQIFPIVEVEAFYNAYPPKPATDVALASKGAKVYNAFNHPDKIIDGVETGYSASGGFTTSIPTWRQPIIIELDQVYKLNHIDLLLWDLDDRYYQYYIEASKDNKSWEKIADKTAGEHKSWQNISFDEREIKYIRVIGTYGSASQGFHVVELKAYNKGIPPKPVSDVALASKGAKVLTGVKPEFIIDGNTVGYTGSAGFTWAIHTSKQPITLELDQVYTINNIDLLLWDLDSRYYQYYVQVSKDNRSWDTVIDNTTGEYRGWQKNNIGDKEVKYIRVIGTNSSTGYAFHVVELEAFYTPSP